MKPKSNAFLRNSRIALFTVTLTASVHAGTTWDGGGGANTNINEALNWGGVVNALDGTTAATFASGGNAAAMNVPARFTTLTFNRDDVGGFVIGGASTLSTNQATAGGTLNISVADTANDGVTSIAAPLRVHTDAVATTRLLNIKNLEDGVPAGSLLISGGISASTAANTYQIRAGGTGVTVLSGTLSHVNGIQQVNSGTSSGKVIVDGSHSLGSATVNIPTTTSGTVSSAYTIQMGSSTADVQSWGATTINQNATIVVNSTATLSGAVSVGTAAGASGATMVVDGALSATTLSIGTTGVTGNLKIGGSASFSGNIVIGAAAGNLIVGNAATNGTLSLSGGTISSNMTIGGANENENNLNLTKINAGTLALNGAHTYTGATNVNAGILNLGGTLASPITVNAGATLGGEGSTTGSLTFTTGISALQFDPSGTPTDALTANTVDVTAAGSLVLVSPTAATTPLSTYTVLKRVNGSFVDGDLAKFALTTRSGSLSITGDGKEIRLTAATSKPVALVWKGNAAQPTFWDVATTLNWDNDGSADRFYTGDVVTFNDTASEFNVVVQGTSVSPGNIVFDNTTAYNLSGGSIGGGGSLTKNNSGTVTLANSLAHTNGITVNAGVLALGSSSNTFTGGINITGGELTFSGASLAGSLNAQSVTLTGGTITRTTNTTITNDAQTFAINSNGSVIKVDSAATATWRIGGKISGSGNWIKSGTGVLALGQTNSPGNDFTGTVNVTGGTLDVRHGDSLGTTAGGTSIQSAVLLMQNFSQTAGTVTVDEPLDFSGTSFLTGFCQENKTFTQQFNGAITVQAGTTLGISTARTGVNLAPILELNGTSITTGAGSLLNLGSQPATYPTGSPIAAAAQTVNIAAAISGPGAVTAQGDASSIYTLSAPGYSGNTTVNSGTLKLGAVNANNESSTVTIESGAKIDIAFSGNDTVATLILGGTNVGPGTYNATTHPAFFAATDAGSIVVPAPAGGYSAWQTANAPGQTVAQDHDNDGVDNGIEYFMGQSGTGFTALPVLDSSNNITWTMGDSYTGTYGFDYVIQTSSDLNAWTPVVVGEVTIDNTAPGKSVSYTITGAGKRFVRLLVNPN